MISNITIELATGCSTVYCVKSDAGLINTGNFKDTELFIDSLLEMRQITNKQWRQLDRQLNKLNSIK